MSFMRIWTVAKSKVLLNFMKILILKDDDGKYEVKYYDHCLQQKSRVSNQLPYLLLLMYLGN